MSEHNTAEGEPLDPLDQFADDADQDSMVVEDNAGGFPLNRVVAFLGPHIAWIAGAIATWLVDNIDFIDLDQTRTADAIAQIVTFVVVTAVTWLGQRKWLDGYSKWERTMIVKEEVAQQALAPAQFPPVYQQDPLVLQEAGPSPFTEPEDPDPDPDPDPGSEEPKPEGGVGGKPGWVS